MTKALMCDACGAGLPKPGGYSGFVTCDYCCTITVLDHEPRILESYTTHARRKPSASFHTVCM
jgi:hypothetical protein